MSHPSTPTTTTNGQRPTRRPIAGDADIVVRFAIDRCSLGLVLVAASRRGICAVLMGDDADALVGDLRDRFPRARLFEGGAGIEAMATEVVGAIEVPSRGLNVSLDVRGTAFQQRVWQALCAIPAGAVASYGEIARRIGAPAAARAVARACAANPVAMAIPCHRVVRKDGVPSGYRWGIYRKRALLEREGGA